jgi:hypothetical protein
VQNLGGNIKKLFIMNSKQIPLVVFLFCIQFVSGQSGLGILDLYNDASLGSRAKTLTEEVRANGGSFQSKKGDIFFIATATPAKSMKEKRVSLDYVNGKLTVTIGTQNYYPNLPLWQLVPIVQFADSPYNAAFTASGDTIGDKEAQCKYHRAFLDNLLGLRLFQSNLLNQPDIIWNIPIDAQRKYLLAQSEKGFVPRMDTTVFKTIYNELSGGMRKFTSFLLTDKDVNITFETVGSELVLSGLPYYCFTKTEVNNASIDNIRKKLDACYDEIDECAKRFLKEKYSPKLSAKTNLKGLLEILNENKVQESFDTYSTYYLKSALGKLDSLNRLSNESIGIKYVILDEYTDSFKRNWPLLKKYNPLVYSAVENTSQWAAFFRYVIKTNPRNWDEFVTKMRMVKITDTPPIKTPTSFETNYFRIFEDLNPDEKK